MTATTIPVDRREQAMVRHVAQGATFGAHCDTCDEGVYGDAGVAESVDEVTAWADEHVDACPVAIGAAHVEALAVEAARGIVVEHHLFDRSGMVHAACVVGALTACGRGGRFAGGSTVAPVDCVGCVAVIDQAHAEARTIRRLAWAGYQESAGVRHWSQLTGREQAAWLTWQSAGRRGPAPAIDHALDDEHLTVLAREPGDQGFGGAR